MASGGRWRSFFSPIRDAADGPSADENRLSLREPGCKGAAIDPASRRAATRDGPFGRSRGPGRRRRTGPAPERAGPGGGTRTGAPLAPLARHRPPRSSRRPQHGRRDARGSRLSSAPALQRAHPRDPSGSPERPLRRPPLASRRRRDRDAARLRPAMGRALHALSSWGGRTVSLPSLARRDHQLFRRPRPADGRAAAPRGPLGPGPTLAGA